MIIDFSYYTDRGKVRQKNEDSIFAAADGDLGIFAVADGMGGHYGGEIAGSRLTAALKDRWDSFLLSETDFEMAKEGLKETVSLVNGQLYAEYAAKGRMCGTTAAILFVYGNRYAAINSGDSRIYSCHSLKLRQESMDQTAGNLFSETDEKRSGKLISAVGCRESCELYVRTGNIPKRTVFLICSDGLYRYNSETDIKKAIIFSAKPSDIIGKLSQNAEKGGAADNYSGIAVKLR